MADQFDITKYGEAVVTEPLAGEFNIESYGDLVDAGSPKMGQRVGAAAEAGGRSLLQGAGVLAGAGSGAAAGMALGPVGVAVGGIVGGALGYQAGDLAAEGGFGLRSAQEMPPNLRSSGVFGEAVGGAVPFALAPFGAAGLGLRAAEQKVGQVGYQGVNESLQGLSPKNFTNRSVVGGLLNSLVEAARRNPISTALAEAASAASAGGAAALAENIRPGDEVFRTGLETIVPLPSAVVMALTTKAVGGVKSVLGRLSPGAQQTEAAKTLALIVNQTGEDPIALARAVRAAGIGKELPGMTAAQRTGSPALAALEQHYGRMSKQFGAEATNTAREGLDSIRMMIGELQKTGDPAALAEAGRLRSDYYTTLLTQSIDVAKLEALKKGGRVSRGLTTADRDRMGLAAREALDTSLMAARTVENELWSKVGRDQQAPVSNLQSVYDDLLTNEYEGSLRKPPEPIRRFLSGATKPRQTEFSYDPSTMSVQPMETAAPGATVGELMQIRRDMLALVRAASTSPDHAGMEGVYSDFAAAAMKDIDAALGGKENRAYEEARTFTRQLHSTFDRTFAGRATATGRYGDTIAPEAMLTKALASGKQAGDLQLRDLAAATDFLPRRGFSDQGSHEAMLEAQRGIIRIAAADAIDADGFAKPEKVAKFVKDNAKLLERFPEVREDLLAAAKSSDRLAVLGNRARNVEDAVSRQAAFGKQLGSIGRNPEQQAKAARDAADKVFTSRTPDSVIDQLIRVAEGGAAGRAGRIDTLLAGKGAAGNARIELANPEKAMDGLSRAIVENALERSSASSNGPLDIQTFRDIMTRPVERGGRPLIIIMQEKGLMDKGTVDRMRQLFQAADNIGEAVKPRTAVDVRESVAGQAMTMLARITGSKAAGVAQSVGGGGGGSSIIVHGAAARFMDDVVNKSKLKSAQKIFTEAAFDPSGEKMALLLTKIDNTPESAMAARRINAWLVQSGLLSDPETEDRRSQR